mmetsp:Transcript_25231/g.58781  ORF Transcript_25231/g.58781 Transcript_25231/m.58781 type:complete len:136 (+) Transcript_25231:54-461(+)|eukprot:CAMPEP_0171095968 /NCGR_PEP_ID=MMETSP0766_2-20121228/43477_1 /TAXON_ID=439317 /ORGANISM="Gambierdiscus australes, Strain CAWD 149" /LENGTH=135 /DNA_ID=CAMNT_0011554847 /DNA_START=49 /DNA_END=456 /DNA_ORIENTATION=+
MRQVFALVAMLLVQPVARGGTLVPPAVPQLSQRHSNTPDLLDLLGKGAKHLWALAGESSRSALQQALQGPQHNATKAQAVTLPAALAGGVAAAGTVASMGGWDQVQLGLWLLQTGVDSFQTQTNVAKMVGPGSPF